MMGFIEKNIAYYYFNMPRTIKEDIRDWCNESIGTIGSFWWIDEEEHGFNKGCIKVLIHPEYAVAFKLAWGEYI